MDTLVAGDVRAEYLLRLRDLTRADGQRAGAKAANLGDLAAAGFPVPEGFVIGTAAFQHFLSANGLGPHSLPEAVAAAPVPAGLAQEIREAVRAFGNAPLAVRSSGSAEDLPDASFAGQYQTFLDVRGAEAVLDAVRGCWASAFAAHVAAYRAAKTPGNAGRMAVLVQRLVEAEAAGVAFSANPVTGDREEVVVSAVRGLGERLVSGAASPDEWLVRGEEATARSTPERAINTAQAKQVALLARQVEAYFGTPQDIEWAMAGDQLYLLQARPITTLGEQMITLVPVPVEPPPGFWQREASHYPRPLSPMLRQLWLPGQNAAFRRQFEQMGALLENIEHQEIGGWAYNRLVPLGGKDRPAPPRWLMPLLLQVVPEMRARIKQSRKAIQEDLHYRNIERWYREWHPDLAARIVTLRDLDPATLSDDALDEHLGRTVSLFEEGCTIHFMLIMTVIPILADLAFACRDLLGWDDGQAIELVSGLSAMSTEPSRRLADLARMARERPSVRDLLNGGDVAPDAVATRLTSVDGEFAAAFAEYQRHYGVRALRYEVADPTLAETPALVLALIRDQVARGYDPAADAAALAERRASAVAEARAALAGRSEADGARFERALRRAQEAYPVREDNEFYTVSAPHALVRYAALELGRRLAGRGLILERDDVFYLEMPEARAALRGGEARHALIVRRRAERAWVEAHPGPASYGRPPGPPPALDSLPAEARWLMAAILWGVEQVNAQAHPARSTAGGAALQGIGVSAGRYTGPARVIRDESEFHKIRAGDVLVCPITSPVWSVLFPSVGALVTDTGGLLSHPAIIAREYRVPAVVATGSATHALRDGQIVIVDGTAGLVEAVGR